MNTSDQDPANTSAASSPTASATPSNTTGRKEIPIDRELQRRSRIKLLAVLGVFAVPLLIATLWLHYVRTSGSSLGIAVRGDLIHPAYPLEDIALLEGEDEAFDTESLRGIWTMFYVPQGECAEACRTNLYHMRQVRLALNHRMDRVQRAVLVQDRQQLDATLIADHPGLRVLHGAEDQYQSMVSKIEQALTAAEGDMNAEDTIYLIDPFANLMMRFPADLPPKKMLKDIKHLLKVSRIG